MPYRFAIALVTLLLFPLASRCETLTLELTSEATIFNSHISPSINSTDWDGSSFIHTSLPNVLQTELLPGLIEEKGIIDLSFNLTIGAETWSQTGTFVYRTYSNTQPTGAYGISGDLILRSPIVFNTRLGTFTMSYSAAGTLMLGNPPTGGSQISDLFTNLGFVPVPEPSTLFLLAIGAISLLGARKR